MTPSDAWDRSDWGLAAYVLVAVGNALGLGLDLVLLRAGRPTVTDMVWHGGILGVTIGVLILLANLAGFLGLAVHFHGRP